MCYLCLLTIITDSWFIWWVKRILLWRVLSSCRTWLQATYYTWARWEVWYPQAPLLDMDEVGPLGGWSTKHFRPGGLQNPILSGACPKNFSPLRSEYFSSPLALYQTLTLRFQIRMCTFLDRIYFSSTVESYSEWQWIGIPSIMYVTDGRSNSNRDAVASASIGKIAVDAIANVHCSVIEAKNFLVRLRVKFYLCSRYKSYHN